MGFFFVCVRVYIYILLQLRSLWFICISCLPALFLQPCAMIHYQLNHFNNFIHLISNGVLFFSFFLSFHHSCHSFRRLLIELWREQRKKNQSICRWKVSIIHIIVIIEVLLLKQKNNRMILSKMKIIWSWKKTFFSWKGVKWMEFNENESELIEFRAENGQNLAE